MNFSSRSSPEKRVGTDTFTRARTAFYVADIPYSRICPYRPPHGPATAGTTPMPLQTHEWAPQSEQDVISHPTDLLLVAHGRGRRRHCAQLRPLRSRRG